MTLYEARVVVHSKGVPASKLWFYVVAAGYIGEAIQKLDRRVVDDVRVAKLKEARIEIVRIEREVGLKGIIE